MAGTKHMALQCRTFPSTPKTETSTQLLEISKKYILPINKVEMWLEHLTTIAANQKRGAAKAAETRHRNKQEKPRQEMVYCGVCQPTICRIY